jgi:hypothetical protein
VRPFTLVLALLAPACLFAQVRQVFKPAGMGFAITMPPGVQPRTTTFTENGVSAQGDLFTAFDPTCRIVVSRWRLSGVTEKRLVGEFVQALESSFKEASHATIEVPLHSQAAGMLRGGYTKLKSGSTSIGLWVFVQNGTTIYTISFSAPAAQFTQAQSMYLSSFQLTGT